MSSAVFRFHGELNDFLSKKQRHKPLIHPFSWRGSIKDMIESLGPPHCEIGLILVDGASVDFSAIVQPGVEIDVYAHFDAVDMADKVRLRPPFPGRPRFVLDTHLGRLASYLRMMGFDTLYRNDYPDDELAYISNTEQRILLTRDIGLLKRSLVIYGRWMRATDPRQRIREVMENYDLYQSMTPFRHCLKCNGLVHPVAKAEIADQLTEKTLNYFDDFHQCADCRQVYWKGSHYERMQRFIDKLKN